MLCENQTIQISAEVSISNPVYLWNTGETSESITIDIAGEYNVEVQGDECFTTIKTFLVRQVDLPILESISSDGQNIIITLANTGDFEFSIDGVFYQPNHVITLENGNHTIYIRDRNGCGIISMNYLHFAIPKYFTPNNDGYNDTFDLKGIELFKASDVFIFNRYGKLLKSSKNSPFAWNGTFNNELLPTSDYWYLIRIDDHEFRGHFALKR